MATLPVVTPASMQGSKINGEELIAANSSNIEKGEFVSVDISEGTAGSPIPLTMTFPSGGSPGPNTTIQLSDNPVRRYISIFGVPVGFEKYTKFVQFCCISY